MATVNKNFRIKNGLVVEGSTATVNGEDILTKSQADQSYIVDLIGGQATSANTANTVVKRDANGDFAAGIITANLVGDVTGNASTASALETARTIELTGDITGSVSFDGSANVQIATTLNADFATDAEVAAAQAAAESTASSDATTKANAAQAAAEAYADSLAVNYDAAGSASAAQTAAQNYADGLAVNYDAAGSASAAEAAANTYTDNSINGLDTDDIEEGTSNLYYTDTRARGAVSAQINGGLTYDSNTGEFAVDTNSIATQSYVDAAVSNLVDGAPALLDTLNELAAAINDDASFASTITTSIGEKVAKSGDTMTGALVLHADPTNALEAATKQYVDAAESAAQSASEATAQAALNDVLDGTTDFTVVDISSVSRQVAATTGNIATAAATTAYSWPKADYRSAKFMVKIKNGSHTEVSEILVTLDTSDNVYLTEYGMSSTSGTSLGTITADVAMDGGAEKTRIRVTPASDNSEVIVAGTLLV